MDTFEDIQEVQEPQDVEPAPEMTLQKVNDIDDFQQHEEEEHNEAAECIAVDSEQQVHQETCCHDCDSDEVQDCQETCCDNCEAEEALEDCPAPEEAVASHETEPVTDQEVEKFDDIEDLQHVDEEHHDAEESEFQETVANEPAAVDDEWQDAEDTNESVAAKVASALENRPSEQQVQALRKGKHGSMSDVLAGVASELERNMTIDKLAHELETRPSEQQLEEVNIIRGRRNSGALSNALVGAAVALEKSMTQDKLSHALEHRPSEQQLEACGVMKSKRGSMSDLLASTAVHLEKEMKADAINASFRSKRPSEMASLVPPPPPLTKRSSLSNVLAANARELEKQITVDHVSAGLSKRSSHQELLDRGVLKRPPSESKIIAAAAVNLEKSLASDRVSDTIAQRVKSYMGNNPDSAERQTEPINTGSGLKERVNAYMAAASGKSPLGPDLKERMRAYEDAIKSSASSPSKAQVSIDSPKVAPITKVFTEPTSTPVSIAESKTSESPHSGLSVKERLQAYQEAVNSKTPPKMCPVDLMQGQEITLPSTSEAVAESDNEVDQDFVHEKAVNELLNHDVSKLESTQDEIFVMETKQDEVEDEAW